MISLFSMSMAYETEKFVRNRAAKGMGISEVTDNTVLDIISYTWNHVVFCDEQLPYGQYPLKS